ncbi:unannotated protein [freshwater metagenome]|uniref:Unannotated protein n=1 Tax=freshwater metagenome TaxID=449393 RepID=A0A6J7KKV7_9ZZZZ|nr:hypothetical protein [Actinomycetota bacterium]
MSKSTASVILISQASLPPWGDDGWRFSAAIQLVSDGPDWLWSDWLRTDEDPSARSVERTGLVLRESAQDRAEDIAAMCFTLLNLEDADSLRPWWGEREARKLHRPALEAVARAQAGTYKLAVIEVASPTIPDATFARLRELGLGTVRFHQT